jgi:hypothetical protein
MDCERKLDEFLNLLGLQKWYVVHLVNISMLNVHQFLEMLLSEYIGMKESKWPTVSAVDPESNSQVNMDMYMRDFCCCNEC